jgi:hypothetical protein
MKNKKIIWIGSAVVIAVLLIIGGAFVYQYFAVTRSIPGDTPVSYFDSFGNSIGVFHIFGDKAENDKTMVVINELDKKFPLQEKFGCNENLTEKFNSFFVELNKRALADDKTFVADTMSEDYKKVVEKMRNLTEDQMVQMQVDRLKKVDMSAVEYACDGLICTAKANESNGAYKNYTYETSIQSWVVYSDSQPSTASTHETLAPWTVYNDTLPTMEQLLEADKLINQYQLSLYGKGYADFKVLVNGQEAKQFSMSTSDGETLSSLLYVKAGKNSVSIEITPKDSSEITYAYDIYEFPKGDTNSGLLSGDKYKLFSSTPKGEITGFLHTSKNIELPFEINAK